MHPNCFETANKHQLTCLWRQSAPNIGEGHNPKKPK